METETELQPIPEVLEKRNFATDLDACLRFVAAAEPTIRFCPGIGWIVWDGQRWSADGEAPAIELSKRIARQWVLRAEGQKKKKLIAKALHLEGAARIRAAVDLAESDELLRIYARDLDRDHWLLNVQNGTLDLKTGELRAHRKEDYMTKLAPVVYVPWATHPALDRVLAHIGAKNPEIVPFLARCFGAALTGDASAESLFLLQGDGASGKTTLVEAIALMLGDYAVKLRFESFCLSKHGRSPGGASPDLMTLRGARLAYASEGDQSAKLDAGIVKELTGKEPVTARGLYEVHPVTFNQTWKLWLVSNFDPKAESDDTGIWRRVFKLHFEVVPLEKRDPKLKESLANDPAARSALLSWCLAGCLDWQQRGGGREGLAAPESVMAVTSEYRDKQDLLGEWWKALMVDAELIANEVTSGKSIREHYVDWATEQGATPVQAKRFRDYLVAKGLKPHRDARIRGWKGIKLEVLTDYIFRKNLTLEPELLVLTAPSPNRVSKFAKPTVEAVA